MILFTTVFGTDHEIQTFALFKCNHDVFGDVSVKFYCHNSGKWEVTYHKTNEEAAEFEEFYKDLEIPVYETWSQIISECFLKDCFKNVSYVIPFGGLSDSFKNIDIKDIKIKITVGYFFHSKCFIFDY